MSESSTWRLGGANIQVPPAWSALDLSAMHGVLLVIGALDSGKSTFARWLFDHLVQAGRKTAFLDGDVGQSRYGLPATLTLLTEQGRTHWFVGDVSPRGRMLPLVVGAGRLAERAFAGSAEVVVADTTGLVDPRSGGVALKHALVDQLRPTTLFALRHGDELEPIVAPLRRLRRPHVVELAVCEAVRPRSVEMRQAHRAEAFRRYFAGAGTLRLPLHGRAIFDGQNFAPRRLLALQDADGFALALGVVVRFDRARRELTLCTPLTSAGDVASVRLGAIGVDVSTGRDFKPARQV